MGRRPRFFPENRGGGDGPVALGAASQFMEPRQRPLGEGVNHHVYRGYRQHAESNSHHRLGRPKGGKRICGANGVDFVGHDNGACPRFPSGNPHEERDGSQGQPVGGCPDFRRHERQEHVDSHMGAGPESVGKSPSDGHCQGVAAHLVLSRRHCPADLPSDDLVGYEQAQHQKDAAAQVTHPQVDAVSESGDRPHRIEQCERRCPAL